MENIAIKVPNIMLPNTDDYSKWSVIACDQFTSEKEYWDKLEEYVDSALSTLNLDLPEIYLDGTEDGRIEKINNNIETYLKSGVFNELPKGFILVVRKTPYVERRLGLMLAVDLEKYEYSKKSQALIRSTEGTIEERIPPRLKIRKDAKIELPHIMLLIDDNEKQIIEGLYEKRNEYKKVYDFDLNMGGGHIEGYFIDNHQEVIAKFNKLLEKEVLIKKYGKEDKFLFAVGDGNHSLATAKAHWNKIKENLTCEEIETHPARYALVEVVNLYDEGIYFEPIYRYVFNINKEEFLSGLDKVDANYKVYDGKKTTEKPNQTALPESIKNVDEYIKTFIDKNGGNVDYIHGDANLENLVNSNPSSVGILFNKLEKTELFKNVSSTGALPRKTFSMGEGVEKRYYLESRKIK